MWFKSTFLVHVYVCLLVWMFAHVRAHVWMWVSDPRWWVCYLGPSSPLFFETGSLWTWSSSDVLNWLAHTEATDTYHLAWVFSVSSGDWTQVSIHAWQALYLLSCFPRDTQEFSSPLLPCCFSWGHTEPIGWLLQVSISEAHWVFGLSHQSFVHSIWCLTAFLLLPCSLPSPK